MERPIIPVAVGAVTPRRLDAALAGVAVAVAGAVLGGAAAALGAVPVGGRHPRLALAAQPVPLRGRQRQLGERQVGEDPHRRALLPRAAARLEGAVVDVLHLDHVVRFGLPQDISIFGSIKNRMEHSLPNIT